MSRPESNEPNWDRLFETAAGQCGHVTTKQAAEAGYSTHLLRKHRHAGRVTRPQREIYRLVHFPATEHEIEDQVTAAGKRVHGVGVMVTRIRVGTAG
jgi:hypothetical protein